MSDYHLFRSLKQNLGGQKFKDDGIVLTVVTSLLLTEDTDLCEQDREKPVPRCDKCLDSVRGSVVK